MGKHTYRLAISGYVIVTVEAYNSGEAYDLALESEPACHLYDFELQDINEVEEDE